MQKAAGIFPLIIILFIGVFLLSGLLVFDYGRQVIMFPLLVGVPTCLCCMLLIVFQGTGPAKSAFTKGDEIGNLTKDFRSFLWIIAILPILGIVGPTWGIFIYIVGFLKLQGENWYVAVALGIGGVLFISGIFLQLLKFSLPAGLLGF